MKHKNETRDKLNAGEWVVAGKKLIEPVKETDEPVVFCRTKIDWASEMDD
jgi:hypothetical protein